MNVARRVATALCLTAAVCLLAIQAPVPTGPGIDPDDVRASLGRPLPRPDAPAAAIAFRQLQWQDHHGSYRANGLMEAKAHLSAMRALARERQPPAGPRSGMALAPSPEASGDPVPPSGASASAASAGINSSGWTWLGPGNI